MVVQQQKIWGYAKWKFSGAIFEGRNILGGKFLFLTKIVLGQYLPKK